MKPLLCILLACLGPIFAPAKAQSPVNGRSYLEHFVSTTRPDRHYGLGDTAVVVLQAQAGGRPLHGVKVYYTCGNDLYPADRADSAVFRQGTARLPIGTRSTPGFRFCELRFQAGGKGCRDFLKVAFAPGQIRPVVQMPADFSRFWGEAYRQAAQAPLAADITPLPEHSTDRVEVSLVRLTCTPSGRACYGYLSRPRTPGKHPVLLTLPGAGMGRLAPDRTYAEAGFTHLAIEIHGLSPFAPDSVYKQRWKELGDYWYTGLGHRDTYYYKDVFLCCLRAVDFLCMQPDFDGRNVGVCGGSQGGALTIMTAALHPRVSFLSAFYPAMCDMGGFFHGRTGGWPKIGQKDKDLLTVPAATAEATLAYYDVANFARLLRVPGFYSWGYCDNTCPPTSVYAAYNCIRAPKTCLITPTSAHWNFPSTQQASLRWMQAQVRP